MNGLFVEGITNNIPGVNAWAAAHMKSVTVFTKYLVSGEFPNDGVYVGLWKYSQ